MKRTGVGVLAIAALVGAGAGFLLDSVLTGAGRPTFIPAITLPIMLVLLAGLVLVLAIPIARATRGRTTAPVNPFRALRVAMLARASSIVGAVVGGFGVGLLGYLLTRPVTSLGSLTTVIATAICGAVLVAAGLVAEQLCTIRKDDDDEQPGDPPSGLDAHGH